MPNLSKIQEAEGIFFYPQFCLIFVALISLIFTFDTLRRSRVVPGWVRRLVHSPEDVKWELSWIDSRSDWGAIFRRLIDSVSIGSSKPLSSEAISEVLAVSRDEVRISIERRLGYLNIIAQVSMLLGLLGTVCGLVGSFSAISESNVAPQPAELAGGVSQALMTTIIGLMVSIPTLFCFVHFQGLASRRLLELDQHLKAGLPKVLAKLKAGVAPSVPRTAPQIPSVGNPPPADGPVISQNTHVDEEETEARRDDASPAPNRTGNRNNPESAEGSGG